MFSLLAIGRSDQPYLDIWNGPALDARGGWAPAEGQKRREAALRCRSELLSIDFHGDELIATEHHQKSTLKPSLAGNGENRARPHRWWYFSACIQDRRRARQTWVTREPDTTSPNHVITHRRDVTPRVK